MTKRHCCNIFFFNYSSGQVFSTGAGTYGQLGHGSVQNDFLPRMVIELMGTVCTQISTGRRHTLTFVPSRGRIYGFGLGCSGQLGNRIQQNSSVPQVVVGKMVYSLRAGKMSGCHQHSLSQLFAKTITFHLKMFILTCVIGSGSNLHTRQNNKTNNFLKTFLIQLLFRSLGITKWHVFNCQRWRSAIYGRSSNFFGWRSFIRFHRYTEWHQWPGRFSKIRVSYDKYYLSPIHLLVTNTKHFALVLPLKL